jgi:hypothetical protein
VTALHRLDQQRFRQIGQLRKPPKEIWGKLCAATGSAHMQIRATILMEIGSPTLLQSLLDVFIGSDRSDFFCRDHAFIQLILRGPREKIAWPTSLTPVILLKDFVTLQAKLCESTGYLTSPRTCFYFLGALIINLVDQRF